MLRRPTTDALYELRLDVMARALEAQRGNPDFETLSFDERLGLLVDQELTERENRRVQRHLKAARLKVLAAIEDVDFRLSHARRRGRTGLRFDSLNRRDSVDGTVKGGHRQGPGRLGACDQVRLGKVDSIVLIDVEGPDDEWGVDDDH
jgi:IstB-like ATP binding protein